MRYVTIYNFEELSEKAKKKAIENVRAQEGGQNPWREENRESIKAIAKAMNCEVEIDSYNHVHMRLIDSEYDEEILQLSGKRAYAYVWNNYIEPNLTGKFISKGNVSYYSKVTKGFNCPFTGYVGDMILWDAWNDFKETFTVLEFISRVEYFAEKFLDDEDDYFASDEYIEDRIEVEGYEFTEKGEIY